MVLVVEFVLVDAKSVEQRGVEVAGANGAVDRRVADGIRRTNDLAAADAAASQPVAERRGRMVASLVAARLARH